MPCLGTQMYPEQGPSSAGALQQLSIISESTEVPMLSATSHLSISNLMKPGTPKMTKVLLQHQERLNQ